MKTKALIHILAIAAIITNESVIAQSVTVDYSQDVTTTYPEVYGVVIKSPEADVASLDMLQDHGIKFARVTATLYKTIPNSSIADYNNNVNGIQDPDNWIWGYTATGSSGGSDFTWALPLLKTRGIKTLLSISYTPNWLSHPTYDTKEGVPTDWAIYKDIVGKIYKRFQANTDLVGIWNEPNRHCDPTGSPYSDSRYAYSAIYDRGADAVRSICSTVPIGGPETSHASRSQSPWLAPAPVDFLQELVDNTNIPVSHINFITLHHYNTGLDVSAYKRVLDVPAYVTEWNARPNVSSNTDPRMAGKRSLAWAGFQLINIIKQGARGSAIYQHIPQVAPDIFATYTGADTPTLVMRTFKLFSQKARLGNGNARVKDTAYSDVTTATGALNALNEAVALISNDTDQSKTVSVTLNNLPFTGSVAVKVYKASQNDHPDSVSTSYVTVSEGSISTSVSMADYSAAVVRVYPETPEAGSYE